MELARISKVLSERLGESVELVSSELHASGYRSDGLKLTAKDGRIFFLKHIRENDCIAGGYELPERRLNSLLLSHRIAKRVDTAPRSFGVLVDSKDSGPFLFPEMTEDTAIYQIQEFEPEGVSYEKLLQDRSDKKAVDEDDRKEMAAIIDYITHIHSIRYPAATEGKLKAVYNDGIQNRLSNPELTFSFLQRFGEDDPLLPLSKHGEYIGLVLENLRIWRDRSDRLCALHGDFWSGNVFFRPDGTLWAVDYSFAPWGDPGIDVGHWISVLMWHYYRTGNPYYKDLIEEFLSAYEKKTGDGEIRKALCVGYGMMGVVFIAPGLILGNDDPEVKRKFFENTLEILRKGVFLWLD